MRVGVATGVVVLSFAFASIASAQNPAPVDTGRPLVVLDNGTVGAGLASDIRLLGGNVGIGTDTPAFKLDVQGGQLNVSGGLCMAGDCRTTWPGAGTSGPWTLSGTSVLYGDGNVGIGSSSPAYKLDVTGQVNGSGGLCIAGDCRTSWPSTTSSWTTSGANIGFTAGSVGIGTANPTRFLQVDRPTGNPQIGLYTNGVERVVLTGATDGKFHIDTGNNTRVTVDGPGNVGIGTTSPSQKVDIRGGNVRTMSQSTGVADALYGFFGTNAYQDGRFYSGMQSINTGDAATVGIRFLTASGTDPAEVMRINGNGNIGIGTTSPAHKLHVIGDVRVEGNISALYQDVAEWVDAASPIPAATVVIADADHINRVRTSIGAYDTAVTGVVSAQPGLLLGEETPGKVAVAQSGRVRVKVDASYGAIRAGDLLVTSPVAGYAMRSQPVMLGDVPIHRPGTILGKALEPLALGRGEILVLLTLQ